MPIPDPNKIIPKLEKDGVDEVRKKLAMGVYTKFKIPVIEEWLAQKEKGLNVLTCMYHEFKAPKGQTFKAYEVPTLEKQGWVDTPAKFGKSIKSKIKRTLNNLWHFWLRRWPILLPIIVTTVIALYIHFDSKSERETQQKKENTITETNHINKKEGFRVRSLMLALG